jgi:hypothetical protein
LLFLSFVFVQFQYFFGGSVNISGEGFTYAEYARRGFGELVLVSFFSLLLFLTLSTVTKRDSVRQRQIYSIFGVLLGCLVGVILVSAFQRLLLYESAFGFTRYRIYPHVFMVWLGFLLLVFIALEVFDRQRAFGLSLITACLGFALTLGLLNVDGLVVRRNVERAQMGLEMDTDYLLTLSVDSTPVLVDLLNDPDLESSLRDQIGIVLACQSAELRVQLVNQTWTGFHFSRWRAWILLDGIQKQLSDYPIKMEEAPLIVLLDGEEISCAGNWWLD